MSLRPAYRIREVASGLWVASNGRFTTLTSDARNLSLGSYWQYGTEAEAANMIPEAVEYLAHRGRLSFEVHRVIVDQFGDIPQRAISEEDRW